MKFLIINGSPRGKESNSDVISNWLSKGIIKSTTLNKLIDYRSGDQIGEKDQNKNNESMQIDKFYTADINSHKDAVASIEDNSTVVVVFPLYCDAMPAKTKLFFEELGEIANKRASVKIYFIVHSGFEGALHSRAVESYLKYLSKYLGFEYKGTAIKPGSEGFRLTPPEGIIKTKIEFLNLTKDISTGLPFSPETLKNLAGFELPSEEYKTGIIQSEGDTGYFSNMLKKNNVFDKCFDKPYQKEM